jgi:hypothetical protein
MLPLNLDDIHTFEHIKVCSYLWSEAMPPQQTHQAQLLLPIYEPLGVVPIDAEHHRFGGGATRRGSGRQRDFEECVADTSRDRSHLRHEGR